MPKRPIIVFDVNETLLDLEAIHPTFDRIFSDPAAVRRGHDRRRGNVRRVQRDRPAR